MAFFVRDYLPKMNIFDNVVIDTLDSSSPALFAAIASVITLSAVVIAYMYTLFRTRGMYSSPPGHEQTSRPIPTQQQATQLPDINDSLLSGNWPVERGLDKGHGDSVQESKSKRDPLEFCEHIPAEVKRVKAKLAQKKIQEEMSQEQKDMERDVQRQQLEAIFKLMAEEQERFGMNSMDEVKEQMGLYTGN